MKRRKASWPATRLGLAIMLLGAAVVIVGHVRRYGWQFANLFDDLYANLGSDLVIMAFVILFVDRLAARREDARLRRQLVRELASTDRGLTARAVLELEAQGWLQDGTLAGAQLSGANLVGVRLERAAMSGAVLAGADLTNANMSGAVLTNCNFADAVLHRANLEMADLAGANLLQANLRQVDAALANLSQASLVGAQLVGADLSDANLTNADLSGADLTDCQLVRARTEAVRWDASTRWPSGFTPTPRVADLE